jgi:hypothetical protein
MNPHQMVCHLSDGYRNAFGERVVPFSGKFYQRYVMRFFALKTNVPWPKGRIKTTPMADQEKDGTRPTEFSRDVAELKRLLSLYGSSQSALQARVHPLFGPLNADEWGTWGYKHADHHLRQFNV